MRCGTCKHFDAFVGRPFLGVCRNMGTLQSGDPAKTESGQKVGGFAVSAIVPDHASCSAYEAKN